jgi:flagellar export protein FliJ
MKRFSFRLEPYLQFCRHREDAEYTRLAELILEHKRLEETRRTLSLSLMRSREEMADRIELHAYEAGWYVRHIHSLRLQIDRVETDLDRLRQRMVEQRLRLVEARKRRNPVEKLRERRRLQHERELEKTEQREADDLYLQRLPRTE